MVIETIEEAEAYRAGDRLVCLICGQSFRAVGYHVKRHGITARAYKERFGLAVTRPVCAADVSAKQAASRRRFLSNLTEEQRNEQRTQAVEAIKSVERTGTKPGYARAALATRGATRAGWPAPLTDDNFSALIKAIRSGKTISEACQDSSLPGWSWVHAYIRADPARQAEWDAMWESLPFSQQAKSKKLGRRFEREVAAMREQGMTIKAIATQLGVADEQVRRRCSRTP